MTTVTPFGPNGSVDLEAARDHAAFLSRSGVARLVPAGNTGEFSSLEPVEVIELVRVTREAAPEALVVTGVGGALPSALSLTRESLAAGADGVMVHHPAHTHLGRRGLETYYRAIATAASGRALLYNHTHRVPDELLVALVRERAVWGVKYAVNDLPAFQRARERALEGVWICGTAELWAPFFAQLGSDGFTSGLANAAPALASAMEAALEEGDYARALELRELVRPFEELRAEEDAAKNVPAVRAAMELAGFRTGPPRPPLAPLAEEDERRVAEIWRSWTSAGLADRLVTSSR